VLAGQSIVEVRWIIQPIYFHRTLAISSPELRHNSNQAWQVTTMTKV
jgi:hypothetical protein